MNILLLSLADFLKANPYLLVVLGVWDIIWKGMALWKASQNKQRNWFVVLLLANTIGILPIIYLSFFQKK